MSGHSKWSTIKHKKAASDAKRGKIFSKLAREIMVAAKAGGGDASSNITLRTLLQKAKSVNMPSDNVERAVKKGTGAGAGAALEEMTYEGFAPGGVAVIVQVLTDNHNRSAAEVRHVFTRYNAKMAAHGSVSSGFKRKGHITVPAAGVDEDKLTELVLEAGADDMTQEGGEFDIVTDPANFMNVADALNKAGIKMETSEVALLPDTYVPVKDKAHAESAMKFIEGLEDLDDVQNVYSNFDIAEDLLKTMGEG